MATTPTSLTAPHEAHVPCAVVISTAKISPSKPAIALPSTFISEVCIVILLRVLGGAARLMNVQYHVLATLSTPSRDEFPSTERGGAQSRALGRSDRP